MASEADSRTGNSAQFSGSAGRAKPPDDDANPLGTTEPDSSSPRPPVTPPSIRTAPSVKAPLRLIPPLCFRTHEPVRITLNRCRDAPSASPILRKLSNKQAAPLAASPGHALATLPTPPSMIVHEPQPSAPCSPLCRRFLGRANPVQRSPASLSTQIALA